MTEACSLTGVPSPTKVHVVYASDHQAAETVLSGAVINDHAPVYVIEMTGGTFTAMSHPSGVAPAKGSVFTMTIDARTHRLTGIGIVNVEPDMSQVGAGSPEIDLLAQ